MVSFYPFGITSRFRHTRNWKMIIYETKFSINVFEYLGEPWEVKKFQRSITSSQASMSSTEGLLGDVCNSIKETSQTTRSSRNPQQVKLPANKKVSDNPKNAPSPKQQHTEHTKNTSGISPKTAPVNARYYTLKQTLEHA